MGAFSVLEFITIAWYNIVCSKRYPPTDERGRQRRGKLANATCVVSGVFPIGGSVDGIDQLAEHADPKNHVPFGETVEVIEERVADVTTYGGFHTGHSMKVVAVRGRCGFFTASAFA